MLELFRSYVNYYDTENTYYKKSWETKKSHYTAKTKWEKCDLSLYRKEVKCNTNDFYNSEKQSTVIDKVNYVIGALHTAAKKTIPNYMKLKRLKRIGRGIWNPQIGKSSKAAKITFNKWKNSNRTCSTTRLELKQKKKLLRQHQRQAYARQKT